MKRRKRVQSTQALPQTRRLSFDWIVAGLVMLHAARVAHALSRWSATYDESAYLNAGSYLAERRVWDIEPVLRHPPLSLLLHGWLLNSFHFANDDARLFWARVLVALFAVSAGLVVYLWARELRGRFAGIAALILYSFCPNVLAHSGLITSDMLCAALMLVCVFVWRKFLMSRRWIWFWIASALAGAAILSKFSALVLIPVCGILALFKAGKSGEKKTVRNILIPWLLLCVVALFIIHAGYLFSPVYKPRERYHPRSKLVQSFEPVMKVIPVPLPFVIGSDRQQYVNEIGHPAFLWGQHSVRGWWYYFPTALFLKTPAAFLPLIVLAVMALLIRRHSLKDSDDLFNLMCLLLPPLAIFLPLCFANHNNAGFRYALGVLPFLHIFISQVFVWPEKLAVPLNIRRAAVVLLAAYACSSILIHPNYISYFTEWIGGSRNGYKYLADSNLDWGQDVNTVTAYQAEHSNLIVNPTPNPAEGLIACNANNYQDVFRIRRNFEWLHRFSPEDRITPSWLLWKLDLQKFVDWAASEPKNQLAAYALGCVYFNRSNYQEAQAAFERARTLDPDDPRPLWMIARIELMSGLTQQAEQHLIDAVSKKKFSPEPYQELRSLYKAEIQAAADQPTVRIAAQNALTGVEHRFLVRLSLSSYDTLPQEMNPASVKTEEYVSLLHNAEVAGDQFESARIHNNLGFLFWSTGQFDEAETHLRRAMEQQPDYLDPKLTLAELLQERGEIDEAQQLRSECTAKGADIYSYYNYFVGYGTEIVSLGNSLALPIPR